MAIIAVIFSFGCLIITFLRVEVHITHETYIGIIATLIGVMVTFAVCWQIFNLITLEKRVSELVVQKMGKITEQNQILKSEIKLEVYSVLLRGSLSQGDLETALKTATKMIEDIVLLKDAAYASIIVSLLYEICKDRGLQNSNVIVSTIDELLLSILLISPFLSKNDNSSLHIVIEELKKCKIS